MAESFKKTLQSGLFTFLVDSSERPYTVHAAAIANQSRAFDVMINGNFQGRESKTETLKDVDEETFARFCEFAYKGDYCAPAFELEKDENGEEGLDLHVNGESNSDALNVPAVEDAAAFAEVPAEAADDPPPPAPPAEEVPDQFSVWGTTPTSGKKKKKQKQSTYSEFYQAPSKRELFRQEFIEKEYSTTHSIDAMVEACKPVRNTDSMEDFSPVFLGHARLYVFADKYDIEALKMLALYKLQQTLAIFTLYRQRVKDIVKLIEYTYENTMDRVASSDGWGWDTIVPNELRDLVVGYVVSELERISGDEFDHLVRKGGDFVVDFWHKIKNGVLEPQLV